jgi:alpha-glucosidase (family GH31 glycosyl hydrolase)
MKMNGQTRRIRVNLALFVLGILAAAAIFLRPPDPSTALASGTRYFPPPAWILGPIIGSINGERTIDNLLDYIEANNLPVTTIHFDSDNWETCNNNATFRFSDALIQRLHSDRLRAIFWIVQLIDKTCPEYQIAAGQGYFVTAGGQPLVTNNWEGKGSWINFNNPAAVAYWHSLLDRVLTRLNGVIGGFYIDNVRPDLNGNSTYADAFALDLLNYTRSKIPDGDVVMKDFGKNTPDDAFLSAYAHTTYVNDAGAAFPGMRSKIRSVFLDAPFVPAAFSEFPGYLGPAPDANVYTRRLHWGALQVVMEDDTDTPSAPWKLPFWHKVESAYQYYTTLHWELVPYLHTLDEAAYETNTPILQGSSASKYSTMLGNEIFVNYVTNYVTSMNVTFPAGQWIDYWDNQQVFNGPTTVSRKVQLGREPIFLLNGAILPMQVRDDVTKHGTTSSTGALTVQVYPAGTSSFRYYDPTGVWSTLSAQQNGSALTLCTQPAVSQPVIYRIERWGTAPTAVNISDGAIGVNTNWGNALPQLGSELDVDGSQGGWFYDAAGQQLIVKVETPGANCPPS